MQILLTGGTGFLGTALTRRWTSLGHTVRLITRSPTSTAARYAAAISDGRVRVDALPADAEPDAWRTRLDGVDVVVNLAGESIAGRRWSGAQKTRLNDSRVPFTAGLRRAIDAQGPPLSLFVSASAIGYYGSRDDECLVEESAPGADFLARLCVAWEDAARPPGASGVAVALLRTGIVLDASHGALGKMLTPFKLGLGGPVGSGRQYMSWVHRDDWVSLVTLIVEKRLEGAFNVTTPTPVQNAVFAKTLGRVLRRPSITPLPAWVLKLMLGEMGDALLLSSQRVLPARAQREGFVFQYPSLEPALTELVRASG
ncbi:MAG: TIGR01777 family oxidoreductase [Vicinamibacterales bacterium]